MAVAASSPSRDACAREEGQQAHSMVCRTPRPSPARRLRSAASEKRKAVEETVQAPRSKKASTFEQGRWLASYLSRYHGAGNPAQKRRSDSELLSRTRSILSDAVPMPERCDILYQLICAYEVGRTFVGQTADNTLRLAPMVRHLARGGACGSTERLLSLDLNDGAALTSEVRLAK